VTIKPGDEWGRLVARPDGLVTVGSDREVVEALHRRPTSPVAVTSGDLARTLGAGVAPRASGGRVARSMLNEIPIDLVEVSLDGGEPIIACAHVVARSPWYRGHWLRGPILAVMNAEFIGEWDVAPRGHPNDGRVEVFEVEQAMSLRHRLAARRRLRSATHLPHPDIGTRSVRSHEWSFPRALDVEVDGRRSGRASSISVRVVADAAVVYA
jgi:hypothetical protein